MGFSHAYVVFKHRNLAYIVETKDIRDFHPKSANDFDPSALYSVKWEKSDLGAGKEADYHPAFIKCIGASVAEIEAKRVDLRLKKALVLALPTPSLESTPDLKVDNEAVSTKEASVRSTAAMKRKMLLALTAVDSSKVPKQSATSTVLRGGVKSKKGDGKDDKRQEPDKQKKEDNGKSMKLKAREMKQGQTKKTLEDGSPKRLKGNADIDSQNQNEERKHYEKDVLDQKRIREVKREEKLMRDEEKKKKGILHHKNREEEREKKSVTDEELKKDTDKKSKEEHKSKHDETELLKQKQMDRMKKSDKEQKQMDHIKKLEEEQKQKDEEKKMKKERKLKHDESNLIKKKQLRDSEEVKLKPDRSSVVEKKKHIIESSSSSEDSDDSSSKDDKTVDPDFMDDKAIKALAEDKALAEKRLEAAYRKIEELKKQQGSRDSAPLDFRFRVDSPPGSPGHGALSFDLLDEESRPETEAAAVVGSDEAGEGSSKRESDADSISSWTSDEEDIIDRVANDLSNADPLPRSKDNRRVYLGSGHWIDRDAWDKGLKVQTKDSLFCNDLPQAVWGKKAMKSRSLSGRPGHNAKAKDKATPRKVKLCEAVFKGRLHYQGVPKPAQNLLVKSLLKTHMSSAFYEAGRERVKKPKRSKEDQDDNKTNT